MQINRIQGNYSQSFGALNIDGAGRKAILKHFNPEQIKQIKVWKKDLAKTKNFDLDITTSVDDIYLIFNNKKHPFSSSEGPLQPAMPRGNEIKAWGFDIFNSGNPVVHNLKFSTPQEATQAYETLTAHRRKFMETGNKDQFERVAWAVDSTKILEKSHDYMEKAGINTLF
jgi:hypothetical protein